MKKYIKKMLIIIFFMATMWLFTNTSNAASISLTPSKSSAEAGENVNVTVSSDCIGRVNLTVSNGKISINKVWVEGGTQSVIVTVGNSGTTTITASAQDGTLSNNGVDVPISAITKSISIKSNNASGGNSNSTSNSGSNSNTSSARPQTKSNVATLANLGIKGQYDFTGFKSSKTAYSVTVPNEAESVEIYATKGQSGQKITGTGVKQLNEGANTVNVVVTAEDGKTTKTYTINIERKASEETAENPEESTEETSTEEQEQFGLKELKIEGIEITPEFKTDVYKYTAKLNENKTRLELITTPTVENAEIEISGNEDLKDGENIITIIVKEKDTDKTATYQITVNKILDEQRVTNATINKIQLSKKKMILLGSGVALLLIIIITIIVIIKRRKKVNNSSDEYYYSQLYSSTEAKEENISKEVENDYEEQPKKTRHSKGKRFK